MLGDMDRVYHKLRHAGLRPDLYTYTILITNYRRQQRFEEAVRPPTLVPGPSFPHNLGLCPSDFGFLLFPALPGLKQEPPRKRNCMRPGGNAVLRGGSSVTGRYPRASDCGTEAGNAVETWGV